MRWCIAGREDDAVDIGRAGIGRVVVLEKDAMARQSRQRGGVLVVDEIRAHPVPDHDHDMLRATVFLAREGRLGEGEKRSGHEDPEKHWREICTVADRIREANRDDSVSAARKDLPHCVRLPDRSMSDAPNKTLRFRFPADRRIRLSRDFARVRAEGRTVRGGLLMLAVLPVEGEIPLRVGLVTSKRIGGAVVRNRIRRRLREIVRRHQHALEKGHWLVVIARPAAARADFATLQSEWLRLAERADLLRSL